MSTVQNFPPLIKLDSSPDECLFYKEAIIKLKLYSLSVESYSKSIGSLSGCICEQSILALMRLKPCNLHFTVAYWRGIQPNHKAVPAIQNIVRSYVTYIISTHSSSIKGIIHVEGSGKPRHEWVPVLGDFLRKRVV